MKPFLIFITLFISTNRIYAQQDNSNRPAIPQLNRIVKVYPLVEQVTKKLNGTFNAALGGTSRTLIEISLPPATVEWHYSFSTRRDGTATQNLQLAFQLNRIVSALVPGSTIFNGLSETALSSILTPTGSITANIYVLDATNANAFSAGKPFTYFTGTSVTDATQGRKTIRDLNSGTYYIAIQNINVRSAVLVDFEAAAIQSIIIHPTSKRGSH